MAALRKRDGAGAGSRRFCLNAPSSIGHTPGQRAAFGLNMHYLEESHIGLFLLQLLVLLACARGMGELFRKWKQPALTAELLVGVLLGPTVLGRLAPGWHAWLFPADPIQQNMLETVAWIGVLLLLLDTGLEIDFSIAWRQRGQALVIALSDIVLPMIVAFVPMLLLVPDSLLADPERRLMFALFMATVMTISAMPVAARVLHDLRLLKTDLGFLTMSALAANDIIGWVLFTIILGLFSSSAVSMTAPWVVFVAVIGFAALALTLGRRLSNRTLDAARRLNLPEPATSLTLTVLLGLAFGAFTQWLGIHALFGFFIAGVVIGEAKSLSEETRGIISQMVHALFVPIFFVNIGLKTDFVSGFHLGWVGLICLIGIAGRYLGAWIGVSLTRAPRLNRDLIAIAHTPGGMMEVVVAMLALQAGLILQPIFVAIVVSAVLSSVVMGPWMARALARRQALAPARFLREDAVIGRLSDTDRAGAIRELADRVAGSARQADGEALAREALGREEEYGTAVGEGLALPHVRIDGLAEPILAYGRAPEGILWDAPDGRPVQDIFFLATPVGAEDVHVQILSRLTRAMLQPDVRKRIEQAPDQPALYRVLGEALQTTG